MELKATKLIKDNIAFFDYPDKSSEVDEALAELEQLKERVSGLESQCVTCECAKFADEAIKPSMGLSLYNALKKD